MRYLLPLDRLLFAVHDMDWAHVQRWQQCLQQAPAPLVEPLPDGWWFVHDGRHRLTAAYEANLTHVTCEEV